MKSLDRYFYVKLFEQNAEASYSGYVKKKVLFKVRSNGTIENKEVVSFAVIPAGTEVLITHITISNLNENVVIKRHLKKKLKTNTTDSQRPILGVGEISTLKTDII
jgi:hypothetical protein